MERCTVKLKTGLTLNGVDHRLAVIREATVGDIVASRRESDDDVVRGIVMLGRQIERIGDIDGPLSLEELAKLTSVDMDRLQDAAEELDKRGRDQPEAGNSGSDGLRDQDPSVDGDDES